MKSRQEKLLENLVNEYVRTAQPVSSALLVDKLEEEVSSATIRNELAALEIEGYIISPHTSAGRIPTPQGYQFFVDNFLEVKELNLKDQNKIIKAIKAAPDERQAQKNLAKILAEISGETVIVAFEKNDIYYTGVSNLFSKPEFEDKELVIDLSRVIDHMDAVIYKMFDSVASLNIQIGNYCAFSKHCSAVVAKLKGTAMIAILGPLRMNYQKNLDLINFVSNVKN